MDELSLKKRGLYIPSVKQRINLTLENLTMFTMQNLSKSLKDSCKVVIKVFSSASISPKLQLKKLREHIFNKKILMVFSEE